MIRDLPESARRWVLVAGLLALPLLGAPSDVWADGDAVVSEKTLQKHAKRLGIEIVTRAPALPAHNRHGRITGAEARSEDVGVYRAILDRALTFYSAKYWRHAAIRKIVLCKDLAFNAQLRGAIPDFTNDTLYLDVGWERPEAQGNAAEFKAYLERVFHHDLFHSFDWEDDHKLYKDTEWVLLNPPSFAYGSGGKNMLGDASSGELNTGVPGFLNRYSTSGVEEDKAEIYTYLVLGSDALLARMKSDAVLRTKVAFMIRLVKRIESSVVEALPQNHVALAARFAFDPVTVAPGTPDVDVAARLERARARGRPAVLYVTRADLEEGSKDGVVAERRACRELEDGALADLDARLAALPHALLALDLGTEEAVAYAKSVGVTKAPALVLYPPGRGKAKVLTGRITARKLTKALGGG